MTKAGGRRRWKLLVLSVEIIALLVGPALVMRWPRTTEHTLFFDVPGTGKRWRATCRLTPIKRSRLYGPMRFFGSRETNIRYSNDFKHLAYDVSSAPWPGSLLRFFRVSVGTRERFVLDGRSLRSYDNVYGFYFSDDSRRFAYTAIGDGGRVLVVDGREVLTDLYGLKDFRFSPDSRHWAAVIETEDKDLLFVDGQEVARHDYVEMPSEGPVFIGNPPSPAYLAIDIIGRLPSLARIDAVNYASEQGVYLSGEKLDAPSRRLAGAEAVYDFALRAEGDEVTFRGWVDRIDGRYLVLPQASYGPFPSHSSFTSDTVSPDWKRAAVSFRKWHWFVACDGKEYGPFSNEPKPRFSPDSQMLVFFAHPASGKTPADRWQSSGSGASDDRSGDELERPESEAPDTAQAPDDSSGKAYSQLPMGCRFYSQSELSLRGSEGCSGSFVYLNGVPLAEFQKTRSLGFSPDGRHYAFIYEEDGRTGLYLDGRRAPEFGEARSFRWSADSSRMAVVTRKGEKRVVIESGREGKVYNAIAHLTFSPDSKHLAYWVKNDEAWILVVDDVETLRCGRPGKTGFVGGDLRGGCITRTEKGWRLLKNAGDAKVSRRKWARHLRHMLFDMRLEDDPGERKSGLAR